MYSLKLGSACNNDCIHCNVNSEDNIENLIFEEIQEIVDDIPQGEIICLEGGEPTLREDFFDIVEYCGLKGHKIILQTNGTGLTEEITQKIKPFVKKVYLSIYSSNPYIHNLITRTHNEKSTFEKTIQALKNLYRYSIPFNTQTVISKINMASLYDTFSLIQKECPGIFMCLTYPHPIKNIWENKILTCVSFKELKPFIQPCFRDFGPFLIVESIPPCYIFPFYQNIGYNLDAIIKNKLLKNENYYKYGDVEKYPVKNFNFKRKGPKCVDCFYFEECLGVWKEYVDLYRLHFDLFPIDIKTPWNISLDNFLQLEIDDFSYEDIKKILENNKNYKPVLIKIKDFSKNLPIKLNRVKAISQIVGNYSFPISFLDIPKCYLEPFTRVINTYQKNFKKNSDKCKNCNFRKECFGFDFKLIDSKMKDWK